jgi:hypothetical protein
MKPRSNANGAAGESPAVGGSVVLHCTAQYSRIPTVRRGIPAADAAPVHCVKAGSISNEPACHSKDYCVMCTLGTGW